MLAGARGRVKWPPFCHIGQSPALLHGTRVFGVERRTGASEPDFYVDRRELKVVEHDLRQVSDRADTSAREKVTRR